MFDGSRIARRTLRWQCPVRSHRQSRDFAHHVFAVRERIATNSQERPLRCGLNDPLRFMPLGVKKPGEGGPELILPPVPIARLPTPALR